MWNATVASSNFNLGQLNVVVTFSNGTDKYSETIPVSSSSDLQSQINYKLLRLNSSDSFSKGVVVGPFVSAAPIVSAPTDQDNFLTSLRQLQSAKRAIDLGIITSADSVFTSAMQTVKNAYVSSYVGLI